MFSSLNIKNPFFKIRIELQKFIDFLNQVWQFVSFMQFAHFL